MPSRKRPVTPEELAQKETWRKTLQAIGQRIADRRKLRKLSQEQVTRKLQDYGLFIQRTTYAHYENGYIEMDVHALYAVARALKTTVSALLGESEPDLASDALGEWLFKLRRLANKVPEGRSRALFLQRLLDLGESEAAYLSLLLPPASPPDGAPCSQ